MATHYPGHAQQFMHAFWGVGQMSFVKHAIFVNQDAPPLEDYENLTRYILNRITKEHILISSGVVDHLDHSSSKQFVGGKLGIDATGDEIDETGVEIIDDSELLEMMQQLVPSIVGCKQYYTDTKNPICVISVNKKKSQQKTIKKLKSLSSFIKILVIVDNQNNDLSNPYMLLWRVVNNIDATRDIKLKSFIAIDATNKNELDGFEREWPDDTHCTKEVLDTLEQKGIIDIDDEFIKRFGLLPFEN
jgi:4-hydroxy-3-polyprenylbenzoate decarboxylase